MPFVSSVRGNFGLQKRPFPISDGKMSAVSAGGTITTAGGYRIHTFTSSSTFSAVVSEYAGGNGSVRSNGTLNTGAGGTNAYVEYLMVGGGGASGGLAGAGGAGGFLTGYAAITQTTYPIGVGPGGAYWTAHNSPGPESGKGIDSTGFGLTAYGGGLGGFYNRPAGSTSPYSAGGSGGGGGNVRSGGGGGAGQAGTPATSNPNGNISDAGVGVSGQGFPGGTGNHGHSGSNPGHGGAGGNGLASSISGSSVTYAGGGGGGGHQVTGHTPNRSDGVGEPGGSGGGGAGRYGGAARATDGTNYLGGGGGAGGHSPDPGGGNGGIGVVIVRYAV